ncbi:GDP-L-fucose synthase 1 [Luminiphilus syltensis NOR5-1B]|uniref:GDP-L-fucose synthase n=2 Tax=Luminiphilus TaxID=1341118 RepID=B8KV06_9GAMM|nr:GDP-L-fucose synthase 1 [Luminiphilus syltensis NOR5-1B]
MVGSAIVRQLHGNPNIELVTRARSQLDLTNQHQVSQFFKEKALDQVYLAAAKVGGIYANNTYPGEFIYQNLMIQANVIHGAFTAGIRKLLFLGSSCIYPRLAEQPISEETLLTGPLEPTNEPYAIAKIAGIKLCESYNRQYGSERGIDYRSVMPTNLYGPGDNYHLEDSHVIPALIRRFHEAKENNTPVVKVWGTGKPKREFLYVDDMARACVYIMNLDKAEYSEYTKPGCSHVNVGAGADIAIKDLAELIADVVGYVGAIAFDSSMPDGSPRKLMNSNRILNLGWRSETSLRNGLAKAYSDFKKKS